MSLDRNAPGYSALHLLVADSNAAIVGFALLGWRRHRIARALMRALASIALNAGCPRFQRPVLRPNEPARRFYESLGAEEAHDCLVMQLRGDGLDRLGTPGHFDYRFRQRVQGV
jgi:GNAT superfamily N-acetyltransferase